MDEEGNCSSVKHGEGSIESWTRMAASGTGLIVFIGAITHDDSSSVRDQAGRYGGVIDRLKKEGFIYT